jgi:hypothetical protein
MAGTAPRPTIHLHPPSTCEKAHPMRYATTCPPVMNRLETVTNLPLHCAGAISEIYSGVTKLALPTARPITLLPRIIPHTVVLKACHTAPSTNSASARSITLFLPNPSANSPDTGETRRANSDVLDVIKLLSRVVNALPLRLEPTDTRVEDITPVLYHRAIN